MKRYKELKHKKLKMAVKQLFMYSDDQYIKENRNSFVNIYNFTNDVYMRKKTSYMIKKYIKNWLDNNQYSSIPFYTHIFHTSEYFNSISISVKNDVLYIKKNDFSDILSQVLDRDFVITKRSKWFWVKTEIFYLTLLCKCIKKTHMIKLFDN